MATLGLEKIMNGQYSEIFSVSWISMECMLIQSDTLNTPKTFFHNSRSREPAPS